jgi:hypothetical protein
VFGDRPELLLEAIKSWPGSCGLNGWNSLPDIARLHGDARNLRVPVVPVTGLEGMPGWSDVNPPGGGASDPVRYDRRRRCYEIVLDQALAYQQRTA